MSNMGLMTDATGEGEAGAHDVSLVIQERLKKTHYNGSKNCTGCGTSLDPFRGMLVDSCNSCRNESHTNHLKNRMAPK